MFVYAMVPYSGVQVVVADVTAAAVAVVPSDLVSFACKVLDWE